MHVQFKYEKYINNFSLNNIVFFKVLNARIIIVRYTLELFYFWNCKLHEQCCICTYSGQSSVFGSFLPIPFTKIWNSSEEKI